eukprot:3004853-Karenia_brevis.AAC.1
MEVMDAKCVSFSSHIESHRADYVGEKASKISIDNHAFVSHADLSRHFAKLKPKGVGENRIGGELYAVNPDFMSKIYHPLATKTVFHAISPLQWAGGQLME